MTWTLTILFLAAALIFPEYQARITRVIDGDTVAVQVQIWPGVNAETSIRLRGVDTPELRGRCDEEKRLAREAKGYMEKLLPKSSIVKVRNLRPDKYAGRHDADIILSDGQSVAYVLVAAGLARNYDGGKRAEWC